MKYLNTLLAFLFIQPVIGFAQNGDVSTNCDAFQSGLYAGIRVGPSILHSKSEIHSKFLEKRPATSDEASPHHSKIRTTSGSAGLQLGYLYHCEACPLIFAPEIFIMQHSLSAYEKAGDEEPFTYKIRTRYSFGGNVRIGVPVVHNLFVYGFAGIACSPFRLKISDDSEGDESVKRTKHRPGFIYGFGVEHELVNTHRIRFEGGFSNYRKTKFHKTSGDFFSHSVKIRPRIYTISMMYSVPF